MDIINYLKALPVVAALLLTASCSSEDNEIVEAPQTTQTRIVPFTASVSSSSQTRATLNGSKYMFQEDDKLYVWTEDGKVYGELSWVVGSGENGDMYNGEFSGKLKVETGGDLNSGNTTLYAVIKSKNDQIFGTLEEFKARGFVPDYSLATSIANSNAEAVQKFSYFKSSATYWQDGSYFSFNECQYSAFISFEITLDDGTVAGHTMTATINNGGSAVRTGTVTAYKDGDDEDKIKVKFVAGFPTGIAGTTLSSAEITLGGRAPISFGGTKTLEANKVYNVKKTYTDAKRYTITVSSVLGSQPSTGKPMGYQTTVQAMLGTTLSSLGLSITGCSKKGDGTSVVGEELGGSPYDYRFTVKGEGKTQFTISVDPAYYGQSSFDVTITVVQE